MTPTSRQSGSKDQILLQSGTAREEEKDVDSSWRTVLPHQKQNGPGSVDGLSSDVVDAGSSDSVKRHLLS
jgi:hypothetical protein